MKNIILCFDGTCNDPSDAGDFFSNSSISNVLKMHALFGGSLNPANRANPKLKNQRSFYYSGVGTHGGWLRQAYNAMFAPQGSDMEDIIAEASKDLNRVYPEGDNIFIFGFSRGAAIARIFAARHVGKRPVQLLGVFDTVAAIKGSLDLKRSTLPASGILFENGTLARHVKRAVHLVAIDEKRLAFQPTLFNLDRRRVTEVWFAGVHSDIGGGYWFDGLSDIALDFMCSAAKEAGLKVLSPSEIRYSTLKDPDRDHNGPEDAICKDDIAILPLATGTLHEQQRSGMGARTLGTRLIRVNEKDEPGKELPIIHHSVVERFNKVPDYRPYALRNGKFVVLMPDGSLSTPQTGIEGLRRIKL